MKVCEIYQSIQGEGILTGTPSVFIRTSGCNLRCGFCDTPFASWEPEGEQMSPASILNQIDSWPESHFVLTGGEPMIWPDLPELCQGLRDLDQHITIETAGTIHRSLKCDLMSISPKLSNSRPTAARSLEWHTRHEVERKRPEIVQRLIEEYNYQLKFVVDSPNDLPEILTYLDSLRSFDNARVLMMPQGISPEEMDQRQVWIEPFCEENGFAYCDRAHLRWFGNRRGT